MKLKKLEIALESINKFEKPNLYFEQYQTPSSIAAALCHMAYIDGNIINKNIADLGCGTGILSIAS